MLLLTLRGTPTIYYGEEIGMADVPVAPSDVQDPYEKKQPGLGLGRDPERSPMPWDASPGAGFTRGRPWLPLATDHGSRNVAVLSRQPGSILNLYRRLIDLRRRHPALSLGGLETLQAQGDVLVYQRTHGSDRLAVLLNMGPRSAVVPLPRGFERASVALSTFLDGRHEPVLESVSLRGDEGVILVPEGSCS
jgi:alpha-glucosidase